MNTKVLKTALVLLFTWSCFMVYAQKATEETITIKSVIACQKCVDRIQNDLPHLVKKGIKTVKVNVATNEIVVTYKTDKTNPDAIRKAITTIGYDADNMKADEAAFKKLPEHCRQELTTKKEATQRPAGCPSQKKSGCSKSCTHKH
ncbi:MAG: heavy-metal-associated domain-containing protein [Bacteroidales bacterium]|nr:heavy-metal-associated domain-containing protein [Bacteroidales bacterium]